MFPTVGNTLGAYTLVRELGKGGMGIVFEATDARLGARVAIKVLLDVHGQESSAAKRFERESHIVMRLHSPHIVRTLAASVTPEGYPYIVMEFFDGCDLARLLASHGHLTEAEVVGLAQQLCSALSIAHDAGVVHRDLKPANIFVALEHGATTFKLMDFGIAKDLNSGEGLTATSTMIGTTRYMSPEQVRSSRQATSASDLWSVGVIMFKLLSGRYPFVGATQSDVAMSILLDPAPSLQSVCPTVTTDLASIVDRLLLKAPSARFGSARDLGAALHAFPSASVSPSLLELAPKTVSNPEQGPTLSSDLPTPKTIAAPNDAAGARGTHARQHSASQQSAKSRPGHALPVAGTVALAPISRASHIAPKPVDRTAASSLSSSRVLAEPDENTRTLQHLGIIVGVGSVAVFLALATLVALGRESRVEPRKPGGTAQSREADLSSPSASSPRPTMPPMPSEYSESPLKPPPEVEATAVRSSQAAGQRTPESLTSGSPSAAASALDRTP